MPPKAASGWGRCAKVAEWSRVEDHHPTRLAALATLPIKGGRFLANRRCEADQGASCGASPKPPYSRPKCQS